MQRIARVQPVERGQVGNLPAQGNAGAFKAAAQAKAQGGQQQQQVGTNGFHGVNRQLQVVNAALEHLGYLRFLQPPALHHAKGADQRRAQAVVHVLHQALALLAQGLPLLDVAQADVALRQLGLACLQFLLQAGIDLAHAIQRAGIAAKHDVHEDEKSPHAGIGAQEAAFHTDMVVLQQPVIHAEHQAEQAPAGQQHAVTRAGPPCIAQAAGKSRGTHRQQQDIGQRRQHGYVWPVSGKHRQGQDAGGCGDGDDQVVQPWQGQVVQAHQEKMRGGNQPEQ
ncbi:hypothetical protein D9M73_92640 [compost metagenome]